MSFDYEHINLIPRMCIVESRSECNTSVKFGTRTFNLPVMPANMECVINKEVAMKLAKENYFYVMHRFNVDVVEFCNSMIDENLYTSISLGVNLDSYTDIDKLKLYNIEPDYITIDIAHGHSIKMKCMIQYIREKMPNTFIIAGNVSSPEAVEDLELWGAHAIKVGIGPGSACTTYNATGFGSRGAQASVLEACARVARTSLIIADGGISYPGDITKSLVLGAHMVMIGGMFSGLTDSPGNTVEGSDGKLYKEFWGSASAHQSNKKNRIEGTKKLIPMKQHTVLKEMKFLEECLQSAISYGGGKNLHCLKDVTYFTKKIDNYHS
jgi:GMP reductase